MRSGDGEEGTIGGMRVGGDTEEKVESTDEAKMMSNSKWHRKGSIEEITGSDEGGK